MQKKVNIPQPGLYLIIAEVSGEQTTVIKLTAPVLFCCTSAPGGERHTGQPGNNHHKNQTFPPPSLLAGFYVQNYFILHLDKHMSQLNKDSYIPHQCVPISAECVYYSCCLLPSELSFGAAADFTRLHNQCKHLET